MRLKRWLLIVAFIAASFGGGAMPALGYSNLCITHLGYMSGPGGNLYRHTVGNKVSGTDYKIVIVQKLAPAGYWYNYDSFRRYCPYVP